MLTPWQFLLDLSNPNLDFLARALLAAVIASIVCAVVGCYIVLRGMSFIGDAISHAVFPGLAIAFALQISVLIGGAVAGAVVAVLIALVSQRHKATEDSVIGIFFAASFAVGMIIISRVEGYTASLGSFLFGSLTGVSLADIITALCVGVLVIGVLMLCGPQLNAVCLDRETARAMGLPTALLDVIIYLCVTGAIVISVGIIGNILVLALVVTPAATARLLTTQLKTMMGTAVAIGCIGSVTGIYLAWAIDLPTGATIVLTLTALFILTWLIHPYLERKETPCPAA